jgi:alpha-tubulin suppressor-like RCC1 family protein
MTAARWQAVLLSLPLFVLGCDSSQAPPDAVTEDLDISGIWDFTDVLVISSQVTVCRDTGSWEFEQSGNSFTARGGQVGTCSGRIANYPSNRTLEIVEGEISDSTISFKVLGVCGCGFGECRDAIFVGTVRSSPKRIEGYSACSVIPDGDWEAVPAVPVGSLEFAHDSVDVLVGESIRLEPILRSESGRRVFQRPITWTSSSDQIVQVGEDAAVLALAPGTATVRAESQGHADEYVVTAGQVTFTSVESGLFHTCGIDGSGTVFCWGANDFGQSGPAPSLLPCSSVACRYAPGPVPAGLSFASLTLGFHTTCALSASGEAHCWGANYAGQLGIDVATFSSATPVSVSGQRTFTWLNSGLNHSCGVATDGVAYCWGLNNRLQLGDDGPEFSWEPLQVSGGITFTSVVGGQEHTCGLGTDSNTYCWGWNFFGQLGVDSVPVAAIPQPVTGGYAFTFVVSGADHSCGLTAVGTAYCWGRGGQDQLGADPGEFNFRITPVEVLGGHTFQALTAGGFHTCGLTPAGAVYCWGQGDKGQLGNGDLTSTSRNPVQVLGGHSFQTISAGWEHTCGLTSDRLVYCWGSNFTGQLGIGAASLNATQPQRVIGQPR